MYLFTHTHFFSSHCIFHKVADFAQRHLKQSALATAHHGRQAVQHYQFRAGCAALIMLCNEALCRLCSATKALFLCKLIFVRLFVALLIAAVSEKSCTKGSLGTMQRPGNHRSTSAWMWWHMGMAPLSQKDVVLDRATSPMTKSLQALPGSHGAGSRAP